jgi:hypothetical protein
MSKKKAVKNQAPEQKIESPAKKKVEKKSSKSKEIQPEKEITEEGGYIHGVFFSREVATQIVEITRLAIDNCHNKLFLDKKKEPLVVGYIEALEDKLSKAEKIVNYKLPKTKKSN